MCSASKQAELNPPCVLWYYGYLYKHQQKNHEREKTDTKGRITDGVDDRVRTVLEKFNVERGKKNKKHLFTVDQNMQCPLTLAR